MRLTRLVVSLVLLTVSIASSQWLEETLYLPDSFGGLMIPQCLTYDSANNTIYVGGGDCVIAIDGATKSRLEESRPRDLSTPVEVTDSEDVL